MWYRVENGVIVGGPADCDQGSAEWLFFYEDSAEVIAFKSTPTPPNVRQEILSVSQQALASGFLHIIMFDLMNRYIEQAKAIIPSITEFDLLNTASPYYHKAYAETKTYYDQLIALQDQK